MALILLKSLYVHIGILYLSAILLVTGKNKMMKSEPEFLFLSTYPTADLSRVPDFKDADSMDTSKEDSENKTIFLTRHEACDFLGIGDMFKDPKHHMNLAFEYLDMEQLDYWGVRCEEKKAHGVEIDRLGYCA